MKRNTMAWSLELICLHPKTLDVQALAIDIYERTCRTDFESPGFCVLNVGKSIGSTSLRQLMIDLKQSMVNIHESKTGKTLNYLSLSRFDQQTTTKPHLDGGPEECFLMLGYEPSEVDSKLEIFDYAKCAFDLGLTPDEFMTKHNPMFQSGYELLKPYSTPITCFSKTDYQIVCINNSSLPFSENNSNWLGTLHTATIVTPNETKRRVINSIMISSVAVETHEIITKGEQTEFTNTSIVRRRDYNNPQRNDDL